MLGITVVKKWDELETFGNVLGFEGDSVSIVEYQSHHLMHEQSMACQSITYADWKARGRNLFQSMQVGHMSVRNYAWNKDCKEVAKVGHVWRCFGI